MQNYAFIPNLGMTPEEFMKSVFEEKPVYNYENTEDLF
jgi:hypothetical protein